MARSKTPIGLFFAVVTLSCFLIGLDASPSGMPLQACTMFKHVVYGDNVRFTMNGTQVEVNPKFVDRDGYDESVALYLQLQDLIEKKSNLLFGQGCSAITDLALYQLDLHQCNCSYHEYSIIKPGINDSGALFNISGCPYPYQDLVVLTRASVSNETYEDFFNETMVGSAAPNFSYIHPAGQLKFGLTIQNWNWSKEPASADYGYLSTTFVVGFRSQSLPILIEQGTTAVSGFLNASMGPYLFSMSVELGIVLDGLPSIAVKPNQSIPFAPNFPDGTQGETFVLPLPVGLCQAWYPGMPRLEKWKEIYFDPTLGVLFNQFSSGTGEQPGSPTSNSSRPWVLGLAIALPIVFVVAIVVVLALTVPAVKAFFRPFVQRNHATSKGAALVQSSSPEASAPWHRVSKPSEVR